MSSNKLSLFKNNKTTSAQHTSLVSVKKDIEKKQTEQSTKKSKEFLLKVPQKPSDPALLNSQSDKEQSFTVGEVVLKGERKPRKKSSSKRRVSLLTNPSDKHNSEHVKNVEISSNTDRIQDESLLSEMVKNESKIDIKLRSTNSDDLLQVQEDGSVSMQSPKVRMSSKRKIELFNINQQCFEQNTDKKEENAKTYAVVGGSTIEDNVTEK